MADLQELREEILISGSLIREEIADAREASTVSELRMALSRIATRVSVLMAAAKAAAPEEDVLPVTSEAMRAAETRTAM